MAATATLLIASGNPGKAGEVRAILTDLPVKLVTLAEFPGLPSPVESADSFKGNAEIKALHYARLTNLWTLADDSGLEVDALGGRPGVHSSRFAGPSCDAAANNGRLIRELAGVPMEKRGARFRCVVVLASPGGVAASGCGHIDGLIVDDPRGCNGFGYDPHFFVPEYGMTTAEMPPDRKNRISHRARALGAIRDEIIRHLGVTQGGNRT